MSLRRRATGVLLAATLLEVPGAVSAGEWALRAGSHIQLSDYGKGLGSAFDLELSAGYTLLPWLELGLEGWLAFPLPTGDSTSPATMLARLAPVLWLRLGEEQWWSYLKLGAGWGGHLLAGRFETVGLLVAALGVAVAPTSLWIHFGFELAGQVEFAGALPSRAIGVGAFLGYRF